MSALCVAQVLANGLVSKGVLEEMLGEINEHFIAKTLDRYKQGHHSEYGQHRCINYNLQQKPSFAFLVSDCGINKRRSVMTKVVGISRRWNFFNAIVPINLNGRKWNSQNRAGFGTRQRFFSVDLHIYWGTFYGGSRKKNLRSFNGQKGWLLYIYFVASFFTCERTWLCIFSAPTWHIWRRTLHKNIGS